MFEPRKVQAIFQDTSERQDAERKAEPRRRGGGRPTREQAKQRHEELLDGALEHFLAHGFERATIEAIAASLNMTKRTVYARYPDKAALFLAAVHRAIEQMLVPEGTFARFEHDSLEETLKAVTRWRVGHLMTPAGMRLQRVIGTESFRFPEIFTQSFEIGTMPVVEFIANQLRRHAVPGTLAHSRARKAATGFMSMTVGSIFRVLVSGNRLSENEIEEHIDFTVGLFLEGVQVRADAAPGQVPESR